MLAKRIVRGDNTGIPVTPEAHLKRYPQGGGRHVREAVDLDLRILLALPAVTAISSGEAAHLCRSIGDLLIAMSFRRGLRQTVEGTQQARENGADCVGIADTLVSPIARFPNECFIASVETPSFGASYAAPMCLLNGILAACGHFDRRGSMDSLRRAAEEQRTGLRWYQD